MTENQLKPLGPLQGIYRRAISKFAEELFNHLDEDLSPRFFILGIPRHDKEKVWLEAAEASGYTSEFFDGVVHLASEIEAHKSAKDAWKGSTPANKQPAISSRSIQEAVERTLN